VDHDRQGPNKVCEGIWKNKVRERLENPKQGRQVIAKKNIIRQGSDGCIS
jgi:hypothetical protein